MLTRNTALLFIDVQVAYDDPYWGARNNPGAEANQAALAAAFRERGLPVVHVGHDARDPGSPLFPGEPGHAFKPATAPLPGEAVFHKQAHGAFVGTGLEAHLKERGVDRLVIAGFTTNHCVSTTARLSCDLGFKTVVAQDACATFDLEDLAGSLVPAQRLHDVGLAELHGEFAVVLPTEAILQLL
jgi:nicotinamidase-related amidase